MNDVEASLAQAASEHRHRTANTLQMLAALARMRAQRSVDRESRPELLWMAEAIGCVGALEKQRRPGGVDFATYLGEMAPIWSGRYSDAPADLVIAAEDLLATDQAASTLSLIVHELVGNALLHGFPYARPGQVKIRLERLGEGRCQLSVEDDGVGFDPSSPDCQERFGLWLVRRLAPQVRGKFDLVQGRGVAARLTFES